MFVVCSQVELLNGTYFLCGAFGRVIPRHLMEVKSDEGVFVGLHSHSDWEEMVLDRF